MKLNQKAFTLTELLVVVLLIGFLASMVLPKFSKVIESYRLMEAEQMMSAVRGEQERRCHLDKTYANRGNQLSVLPANGVTEDGYESSYFTYQFVFDQSAHIAGMTATDKKTNVILEMPSFADGRICCDNCQDLNKSYPDCTSLVTETEGFELPPADCYP